VSDTPIIDAAIRAGCYLASGGAACSHPSDRCREWCKNEIAGQLATLRAALPWHLPAERLEAIKATLIDKIGVPDEALAQSLAICAYRADPIMRELYPALTRGRGDD
jgi:hypothetical protein